MILIDGNNLAWRSFHTTGGLSFQGRNTGVLYGVLTQVIKLMEQHRTADFVFAWDSKGSYRRKLYPAYKRNRREDLTEQEEEDLRIIHKEINLMKHHILPEIGFVNQFWQTGCEADDIIAKICEDYDDVTIVSGDDDLLQCLRTEVSIYKPVKKIFITDTDMLKQYGIAPGEFKFIKAIAGCDSDNVPGVPGVGEKTALKFWLAKMNPDTKTCRTIEEYVYDTEWWYRQLELVSLPHHKTRLPTIRENKLNLGELIRVCEQNGFNSTLKYAKWDILRELF